jgi:hypothetical protein
VVDSVVGASVVGVSVVSVEGVSVDVSVMGDSVEVSGATVVSGIGPVCVHDIGNDVGQFGSVGAKQVAV